MAISGIITLVTDFGLRDPYVGMMKGVILSINRGAQLVDVSHQVGAGSILQAASFVREAFVFFPRGTVHLAVVDPGVGGARRPIALESGGHYFVGPDNGIFWPVIHDFDGGKIVHLTESTYFLKEPSFTFHGREIFAPVAAHLSMGVELQKLGPLITDPCKLRLPVAYEKDDALFGQIIRVDNFGNLITNIHGDRLKRYVEASQPVVEVGRLTIRGLSRVYSDLEEGQPLVLINSSNWLEIAVNMGRAAEYIGLAQEEIVGTVVKVTKAVKAI
ncbi:MAG: SAM-dependent chlorinase/fluorinase [Deltaproteobacteria bacterium]|nr:SAM-dependent chlorinase/fluorinase [Deltaproteobacteria bacterium]